MEKVFIFLSGLAAGISACLFARYIGARFFGGAGRCIDTSASRGAQASLAAATEINAAVDRAIRTNEQTAEVIQKMRAVLDRAKQRTDGNSNLSETE